MLRAYILETGVTIAPFGDPAGASWIGGRTLKDQQTEEIKDAGLVPAYAVSTGALPAEGPYLLIPDYVYASAACIAAFAAAAGKGGNAALCMPVSPVTEYPRPLSSAREVEAPGAGRAIAYDLFSIGRLPAGCADAASLLAALRESSALAPISPDCTLLRRRHPNVGPPPYVTEVPRTLSMCAHVESWVHILWLNHLLPALRLERELRAGSGLQETLRRTAVSANVPGCVVRSLVGASLDAHPTSRIENSIVGSGARVGARAYVKDCILGDDVVVGDGTRFVNCVVGDRCNSLSDSYFLHSTFYPDSSLSNLNMRHCVAGRNVFLTTGVIVFSESVTGPVHVLHRGRMQSTGRHILGTCMGHEATLGIRAIFMPGLALPNGAIIVMPPGEGVHKIPECPDPKVPLCWDGGTLRPVRDVFPGYEPADTDR